MTIAVTAPCTRKILGPDAEVLRAFWNAVGRPGEVHEVRMPKTRRGGPHKFFRVVSGYFDDVDAFVSALSQISGEDTEGVYLSMNPVNRALLARAKNRLKDNAGETTADSDVLHCTTLLIDIDPVRPAGISSTDEERDAALATRDAILVYLVEEEGWPKPLAVTMSGNGGALLFRVDLPNDAAATALVEPVLHALAHLFNTEAVKVDTANANAARLTKIIGTVAAKGDNLPERPWRLATGALHPDAPPVPREALEQLAALAPMAERQGQRAAGSPGTGGGPPRPLRELLTSKGINWRERVKPGFTVLELDRCLTSTDHTDGAALFELITGAVAYKCHHNGCAGKAWADVRERFGVGQRAQRPALESPSGPEQPGEGLERPPGKEFRPNSLPPHKGEVENETNFCPVSATTLLTETSTPMRWVWDRYLPEGTLDLVVSFMKVGKSTLVYALAIAIAQGHPFLGYPTQQGDVLILAVEEHPRDVQRRLQRFGLRSQDPVHVHRGRLDNSPGTFKALKRFITDNDIKLVILETLPRFWSVEDENDNAAVIRQASPFLELARETGAVVLLLHHERKSGGEDGRSIRGGSALFGLVDQALMLERRQGGEKTHRVLRALGRYEETPPELILALVGNEFRKLGTPEDLNRQARAETVWAVLSEFPQAVSAIAQKVDMTQADTRKVLETFGDRVVREGAGKKGSPFTYRRATQDSILPQANPMGKETNLDLEQVEPELLLEMVEP